MAGWPKHSARACFAHSHVAEPREGTVILLLCAGSSEAPVAASLAGFPETSVLHPSLLTAFTAKHPVPVQCQPKLSLSPAWIVTLTRWKGVFAGLFPPAGPLSETMSSDDAYL